MKLLQQSFDSKRHLPFLLVIGVTAAVAYGYFVLRIQPRELEFAAYGEEITRLREEMGGRSPVRVVGDPAADAKQQLKDAESKRDELKGKLAAYTEGRVDPGSKNAVQDVMLELSALAQSHRVRLTDTEPSQTRPTGMAAPTGQADPLAQRPLRNLQVQASYADLRRFLEALGHAEHAVTVLALAIKTTANAKPDSPQLQATLTVML